MALTFLADQSEIQGFSDAEKIAWLTSRFYKLFYVPSFQKLVEHKYAADRSACEHLVLEVATLCRSAASQLGSQFNPSTPLVYKSEASQVRLFAVSDPFDLLDKVEELFLEKRGLLVSQGETQFPFA